AARNSFMDFIGPLGHRNNTPVAIDKSSYHLHTLHQDNRLPIVITDRKGNITYANNWFMDYVGITEEISVLLNTPIFEFIPSFSGVCHCGNMEDFQLCGHPRSNLISAYNKKI